MHLKHALSLISTARAENGPYHINDDLSLNRSEYGWDVNSNMIFVDQPINTGFSYSSVSSVSAYKFCYFL